MPESSGRRPVQLRHVWLIAAKDGRELLRDRRTIFVNLLLPVLLYPLLAALFVQTQQVAQLDRRPPPRLALLDLPPAVAAAAVAAAAGQSARIGEPETEPGPARSAASATAAPIAEAVVIDGAPAAALRGALLALDRQSDDPARRAAVVAWLRAQRFAGVLWHPPPAADGEAAPLRTVLVVDDALAHRAGAEQAARETIAAWRRHLVAERLAAAGLPPTAMEPLASATWSVASRAEAARSGLAGVLPWMLVMMALFGVFLPAVDLIAGERERGSLETMLSLPIDRRDLLLAKILVSVLAGAISAGLNLLSLGATVAVVAAQLPAAKALPAPALLGEGGLVLGLAFLVLLPVTVLIAALAVAVAGLAASAKEAQNYLSPLALAVMAAAGLTLLPDIRPGLALDLVPITGPLVVLRECLSGAAIPWGHLALASAASAVWAWVVASWAVRRFEDERFVYPGLVRAGWGIWRRWGARPPAPGALEAVGLFAACLGLFLALPPLLKDAGGPVAGLFGGLVLCLLLPTLMLVRLGAYDPAQTLLLRRPAYAGWIAGLLMTPFAIIASAAWLGIQTRVIGSPPGDEGFAWEMTRLLYVLGPTGFVLAVSITPAICEEVLFRGALLTGLRRGIGPAGAVVVQAFLFAAMHLSPYRFAPQFTLGLALGVLALRTGSLLPAMLVHGLHNGLLLTPGIEPLLKQLTMLQLVPLLLLGLAGLWLATRVAGRPER